LCSLTEVNHLQKNTV